MASSVVEPTTFGTVTSFTSRVVINQKIAPVISSNKKKIAKMVISVFFLLGSSKNSSSSSSSSSSRSSAFISFTNSSVSSISFSFSFSGFAIFFFVVTVGTGVVESKSFSGYSKTIFLSLACSSSKQWTKSSCISLAVSYLLRGFLAQAFKIIFSTDCGIDGSCFLMLGILSFMCLSAISTALSPLNGTLPVSNSYIKIPNEYISLLTVAPLPLVCSGER